MSARIARLRTLLEEPLLITNPVNVLYLTGLDSSNVALLVEPERARLFTDFRYIEEARAVEGVEAVQTKRTLIGWLAEELSGRVASRRMSSRGRSQSSCAGVGSTSFRARGSSSSCARSRTSASSRPSGAPARSPTGCSSGS